MLQMIARIVEKMIGINKIYTVGIKRNENLFAAVHFFTFNNSKIHDFQFINSIVRQAGIVILKKIVEFMHNIYFQPYVSEQFEF